MSRSIGIIGGADGPTAIFVTGSPVSAVLPFIGLLVVILLAIWLHQRK